MYASFSDYLECALWSCCDCDGRSLDNYEFSHDAREKMCADLQNFVDLVNKEIPYLEMDAEQFAHDFWLTRNGHGAGFWDRGLGDLGYQLTKLAKSFGECNLWLHDDSQEVEIG